MASAAQIAANQANAQKSTGPTSAEGKNQAKRNSIFHGLCATMAIMSDEIRQEFADLHADLREEHQPVGVTEDIIVYRMAEHFFASIRAQILLAEKLDFNDHADCSKQVSLMLRYHTTADRGFYRALNELRKLQKDRRNSESAESAVPAIGFVSQKPVATPSQPPRPSERTAQTDLVRPDLVSPIAPEAPPIMQKAA